MKIRAKINQIRRRFKHVDKSGMLYNRLPELKRKYSKVRMHTLLVSNVGTWMVRRHVFNTSEDMARTPIQWANWFKKHHTNIMDNNILPAIETQTETLWAVHTIIGWEPLNGDIRRTGTSVVGKKKRHRAKRKGKRNV